MKNALILCLASIVFSMSISVSAQYDGSSTIKQKKAMAKSQALGKNNLACRKIKRSCVDVLVNGSPYTYRSVTAAISAVLKSSLEGKSIHSLSFLPNQSAVKDVRSQAAQLAPYADRIAAKTFVDFPTLPDILDVNDLLPPPDVMDRIDNGMTNDMLRMLEMSSLNYMLAQLEELKAMAGVYDAAPLIFGWTIVEIGAAYMLGEKLYDSEPAKFAREYWWDKLSGDSSSSSSSSSNSGSDKDAEKNTSTKPKSNNGEKGEKITAESEWPMGYALYNMVRRVKYNWQLANQMRW